MNIGKLVLLGGAAYLGYKYFIEPSQGQAVPTGPGGIQPSNNTPPIQPVNPSTTRALILAEAAKQGKNAATAMNADNWNWFYQQARGIAGPDPALLGESRGPNMTLDEYLAWATPLGLSGFLGVGYIPTHRLMVTEME